MDKYEAYMPDDDDGERPPLWGDEEQRQIDEEEAGAAQYLWCMVEEARELGEPVDWAAIDTITYNRFGDVVY